MIFASRKNKYSILPWLIVTWLLAFAGVATYADERTWPIVPAFERFHGDAEVDGVRGGKLLLGELSCTSCHAVEGQAAGWIETKQAPILDDVAKRVKPAYLREYLANPHALKPGSTMPNVLVGVPEKDRREIVEALVHFLVATNPDGPSQAFASIGGRVRGEKLYHTVGCAVCHGSRNVGAKPLATDKPLGDLEKKYTLPSLAAFLVDPLHVRATGRMPNLNLSGIEGRAIAAYLLPRVPEKTGIAYKYYEGSWQSVPDFGKLEAKAEGGAERIDVSPKKRGEQFGLRFDGALPIDTEGEYTFHLGSDDGSTLRIDGELIVDHGGIHGFAWKSAKTRLTKGVHHVQIDFFEQGGDERLDAEFEGPGIKRQQVAAAIIAAQPDAGIESLSFKVDLELAARGRTLFAKVGCASCHAMKNEDGESIASTLVAPPLSKLGSGGCLSDSVAKGIPDYQLSPAQRGALTTAIGALKTKTAKPTGEEAIAATMSRLNCYACHQRGEVGGVEEPRNALFTGTQPEMGDEGRIPPHLSGVGGKLTVEWLDQILAEGAEDRPYMLTRMPKFGAANAGHLQKLLEAEDLLEPLPQIALDSKEAKIAGWKMAGNKSFNCISCHTFGRFKATGVQSIDLMVMHKRLREEWFRRYVDNPIAFRAGTRMPDSWPNADGKSLLPDILDGKNETQIQAMWNYLADGPRARPPSGLMTNASELVPTFEAVIYRNFIQDAGPRAIGVGYPEGLNLAFDAQNMRLALIWQGAFIDPTKHWSGRGQGWQPPKGENVKRLPDGASFAVLAAPDSAWPSDDSRTLGYKFRGYRLSEDRRPTFMYDYQSTRIEDFPDAVELGNSASLVRTFTVRVSQTVKNLYYRAAVADSIEPAADDWYSVDGTWKVRLQAAGKPVVRESSGKVELLLAIPAGASSKLVQTYDW